MELQAKVTALEEELSILKGEIKSILQEVRVAVLARQNPFLDDEFAASPSPRSTAGSGWPTDEPFMPDTASTSTPGPIALPAAAPMHVINAKAPSQPPQTDAQPEPLAAATEALMASGTLDLAGLLSWLQETAEQFNASDFRMLIQLAAYGGLIDGGLEQSLVELGESVSVSDARKASLPEFALALQKLEAVRAMKSITQTTRRNAA
jgi:hypothetical protein